MQFRITHKTSYTYQTAVSHSLNEVRLTPRTLAAQQVHTSGILVQPQPAFMHHRKDYYGNDVTSFELFERHDYLEVAADSLVEVLPESTEPHQAITWQEARRRIADRTDAPSLEASEFVYNSPH